MRKRIILLSTCLLIVNAISMLTSCTSVQSAPTGNGETDTQEIDIIVNTSGNEETNSSEEVPTTDTMESTSNESSLDNIICETSICNVPACIDYCLFDEVSLCYYGTDGAIHAMRFDHPTYDFEGAQPVWSSISISSKPKQLFFFEDDTYIAIEDKDSTDGIRLHVYQAAQGENPDDDAKCVFTERDYRTYIPLSMRYKDNDRTDVISAILQDQEYFSGMIIPGYEWSLGSKNHALLLENASKQRWVLYESGVNEVQYAEGHFVPYEQKQSDTILEDGVIVTSSVNHHFDGWSEYDIVYAASTPSSPIAYMLGLDSDGMLHFGSIDYQTDEFTAYELNQPCPVKIVE